MGLLACEQVADPVAGDDVDDRVSDPLAPSEVGRVPDPDPVAFPPNLRKRGLCGPRAERLAGQRNLVGKRHPEHRRRRHEHGAGIGAAVRELAVRAIDPPPRLDQIEDRLLLPLKQPVDRTATWIVGPQACRLPQAGAPAMRTHVLDLQHPARSGVRPPIGDRTVDQPQQLELDLRAHARGDRAEKPERCFPRYLTCQITGTI